MFKKYNSIENSYNGKYINRWLANQPEIKTDTFIITEKIDGANIQIYFEADKEYKLGKRSSFIGRDDGFFNIDTILPEFEERFKKDHDVSQFDPKDQKTIYNVGDSIVKLLKKQLGG